jgi:hypothetical protein
LLDLEQVKPRAWQIASGLLWLLVVAAGLAGLWRYASSPGIAATPPARWPADSRLERATDRATLVMLLHPHCPCSRASVEELNRLMVRVGGLVKTHLLFLKPADMPADWEKTDLWQAAAAIPGTSLRPDLDGAEAARFGSATSGQALLYDAQGRLLFSGGITPARGHAGDSAGRSAILSLLTAGTATAARTPVFGCSLRDDG